MLLSDKNPHTRDAFIHFDEEPHIYTISGDEHSTYTSVTTWIHSLFSKFDADVIIKRMMNSPRWEYNKYYGKTPDEIKSLWDKNRDEAAKAGTKMHYDIECYYNGINDEEINNNSIEYQYFKNFIKDFPELQKEKYAYRTEWMVWDDELKLAGSIDMVYELPDGTLMIYDWKRSKDIIRNKPFETYSPIECISHIPDTNYWHYALQLNTYKMILEKKYGKNVSIMRLVCLHPDNKNGNYIIYDVPELEEELKELQKCRLLEINTSI